MHSGYTCRTRAIWGAQLAKGWDVRGITGHRHAAPGPLEEIVDGLHFHRTPGESTGGNPLLREWRDISAHADAIESLVRQWRPEDRKSVVEGKSVSVRVDLGGRRIIKKKKQI